ncbi:MAG: acetyl-CoA C-acyltransferase, partial [Bosea sp.]|nr:acetyl-CoA C-acyltransferase [Bosea sp. (in: a-proteobacteria)]
MKVENKEVVFLSGVRTAYGSFGGSLKNHSAIDLGVLSTKAAIERAGVENEDIDHVIFGNVQQTSGDAIYMARHIGLKAGVPVASGGLTVNRLCGSGFQSIVSGAKQILLGESNYVVAGGTENMSQAPYVARNMRWGMRFGQDEALKDSLWEALSDPNIDMKMAETAEKLGEQYGITREECDVYGLRSHQAWVAAQAAGKFGDEIIPVMVKKRREMVPFEV